MNEIVATIIAGLPQMLLLVVIVGCCIVYGFILETSVDGKHDILTGFVLAVGVFACCMGLAYFFGSRI